MFFAFFPAVEQQVKSLLNLSESMYVLCHYLSSFQRQTLHECVGPHIGALNSWRPQGSDKEQHKARVKGHTFNPGAPVNSQALLSVHTTNIVYRHTDSHEQKHPPSPLSHIKNTNALRILQAVAIHSAFCQMSQIQGYWHYHKRESCNQPVKQALRESVRHQINKSNQYSLICSGRLFSHQLCPWVRKSTCGLWLTCLDDYRIS